MATNKRKDSAALFELIDKSTLRVPKNATGALKIPTWWSSKGNPPTKMAASAPAAGVAAPGETGTATLDPASNSANPYATTVPSIRPPVPAATPAADAGVRRATALPPKPQVYIPNTMDRANLSRGSSSRYVPGTQVPIWVAVVGAVAAIVIIVAAIAVAMHRHPSATTGGEGIPGMGGNTKIIPNISPYDPTKSGGGVSGAQAGRVLPSPLPRDPRLYYLVIANYPRQDMADKAANFLADHGVALSIEPSAGHYWLISAQGFAKMEDPDAQALQRNVIEIGHLQFEGRKHRGGIFPDAHFSYIARGG